MLGRKYYELTLVVLGFSTFLFTVPTIGLTSLSLGTSGTGVAIMVQSNRL